MRYSFAPIDAHRGDTELSVLADKLGVAHGTLQKWRERGMEEHNADRVATALGLHPWQLWPEMLAVATAPVMAECPTCGDWFVVTRKGKKFCQRKCQRPTPRGLERKRERQREKYRTDHEWREAKLARRREAYAANPRAELVKQRIRDRKKRGVA